MPGHSPESERADAASEPSEGAITFVLFGVVAAAIAWGGLTAIGATSRTAPVSAATTTAAMPSATAATSSDLEAAAIQIAPIARATEPVPTDAADAGAPKPKATWRLSALASDASIEIVQGTLGKRAMLSALAAAQVAKGESRRLLAAFDGVKSFDRCNAKDTFAIAKEKKGGKIVAFEYATSKSDVWQAREEDGVLRGKKLEFEVQRRDVAIYVPVTDDLRSSIARAGLDAEVLKLLDDALDGHAELSDVRPGARLRLLATEERLDGVFSEYDELEAVEYIPAGSNTPLRVYHYGSTEKHAHSPASYFDAKGQRPSHGGWRSPIPFARVTSRFNPHRMHPVLHVVMPHNGIDYAAPTGTPVYASASGIVKSAGDSGPCGNMVQILHPNGLTTAYCHLSRFASGLHEGERVEARQLIGFSGQTGRVTGPHLHFAVKRGDVFLDPLGLKLDGMHVVPVEDREAFDKTRAALDLRLDAIAMPIAPAVSPDAHHSATTPTADEPATDDTILDVPPGAAPASAPGPAPAASAAPSAHP